MYVYMRMAMHVFINYTVSIHPTHSCCAYAHVQQSCPCNPQIFGHVYHLCSKQRVCNHESTNFCVWIWHGLVKNVLCFSSGVACHLGFRQNVQMMAWHAYKFALESLNMYMSSMVNAIWNTRSFDWSWIRFRHALLNQARLHPSYASIATALGDFWKKTWCAYLPPTLPRQCTHSSYRVRPRWRRPTRGQDDPCLWKRSSK